MELNKYLAIFLILISGCDNVDTTKLNVNKDFGEGYASVCVSYIKLYNNGGSVVKFKRSQCPHCKGSGKIKSGDGIITMDCPYCEADKSSGPIASNNCCPHCICENCQCSYPGECLIKKNLGWPVVVCENGVCIKYMPRNDRLEPYDPYLLLSPQDKQRLIRYKDGIRVDVEGNEIEVQENQSSQSSGGACSTCGSGFGRGFF